jgi:heme oxygenase
MVSWTISFLKDGRALTFANQITRYVERYGNLPYTDWKSFWKILEEHFLPLDESEEAANMLETDKYFQGKSTVEDYCDQFQDLVDHAGYAEGRHLVMKFRKGLETEVSDKVAMLQERRPEDDDIGRISKICSIQYTLMYTLICLKLLSFLRTC